MPKTSQLPSVDTFPADAELIGIKSGETVRVRAGSVFTGSSEDDWAAALAAFEQALEE